MEYFERLLHLLKTEREADRQAYQAMTVQAPASERRANGMAWYPVAIRGTETGRGDYLTIEAERTTHHDIGHQLRPGMPAALFSNHNPQQDRLEGTIVYLGDDRLKLSLRVDELPDWCSDGKLGVELLFDDNSYEEMEAALKEAAARADDRDQGRLIRVLTGQQKPSFDTYTGPFPGQQALNASQQEAVRRILAAQDLAIVHGPPGTGKTTTLVAAIKAMIAADGKQVLVTAPSNAAVDLLSERLSAAGLRVLRAGNPARVSEALLALTLDRRLAADNRMKEVKKLRKQAGAFRDMAHKYKRQFGRAEREQRKALFDEARKLVKEADRAEQYLIDDQVSSAQVITATLVGARHFSIRNLRYHTVVIDEAGQALEPACWIPVLKAEKLVMAGDHFQLPPTVKSREAGAGGLDQTLMERCVALQPEAVVLLEEQYRMHERIMHFPGREFYENRLKAHDSVAAALLFAEDKPMIFIDTAGCGYEEQVSGTRISNPEEAAFLFRHLSGLVQQLERHYDETHFPSIAIISPYRQQVEVLQELWLHQPDSLRRHKGITVNTIDSFQGQERDIVYISMTRSNADNTVGFLSETRRMNVAMTRARKKLVVIGDSATLAAAPFYHELIAYTEETGAYHSAWEFMEM